MTSATVDGQSKAVFETAAEHLTSNVPTAAPSDQAGDIRRSLDGQTFDTVAEIAICEDGKLVGLLNIEDLLAAPAATLARQIMDAGPPVVAPGLDQEMAAWKAVQHGESSLAVVNAAGHFVGLIPPSRLLAVLLWEHDEDMARLGGFLRDTASARTAGQEVVRRRVLHRLPWLLLGLAGAFVAADIVGTFEEQLQGRVILAFVLPGVVYMADAVGTQTEALVIRGLSVGVPIGRVVLRELLTGLLMGLALALAFAPVALWRCGQPDGVLAVALSLLTACSIATVIATSLPWLLQRLGLDPAFGSGPLATVVQDLLSILLYFLISVAIVGAGA